jgi:hypothetical protein
MTRLSKYLGAYVSWLVNLGLAFWLLILTRTVYLGIFALSYKPGAYIYAQRVELADKVFVLILGVGWLIFMIVTESYFRKGAVRDDLLKRFARVTGLVLLGISCVDLLLLSLQGGGDWRRWLILAAELGLGIMLATLTRSQPISKPA